MIWVLTGASGYFWPAWVALFAVVALIRNGWRLYGPGADLDAIEAELEQKKRDEKRAG